MEDVRPRPSMRSKAPQVHGQTLRTFMRGAGRDIPKLEPYQEPDRFSLDRMFQLTII